MTLGPPETSGERTEAVARELDELHRKAKEHFRNRDVAGYMQVFAPGLKYRQANGAVIGKDELGRDVAAQLGRVESADSAYTRESLQVEEGRVIEVLAQRATVTVRRLLVFQSVLRVERRGRYVWARTSDGWRIQEVEILQEKVSDGEV